MTDEHEKILKAREVLQKIANGINPISGQLIDADKESFLNDPRIIRCFFYVSDILEKVANGQVNRNIKKPTEFSITDDEKRLVKLPDYKIGINEFAKCINNVINLNRSKRLTGTEINKQLKKMGLLSEEVTENGKTRTIVNDKSGEYGIEAEKRTFNGREYEAVLFNDKGKKFLLDNIEKIMNYQE
ncbi:MAG: hypothetical protein PWQ70_662 [Clostridiales bacterium]|jgi:hypothetical protein|nr:hypothetical protein [Clostridiales bacterium]